MSATRVLDRRIPHQHGYIGPVGAAGAALLQARQIVRRGSSCDVSARFFATYAGGYAIWLLYGLSIGSVPLILVDAAGLLCGGLTLASSGESQWSRECAGAPAGKGM